jgi:hypothetical protein
MLTGFAIVGWFILRWSPRLLTLPMRYLWVYPVRAAWVGFVVGFAFLFFPFATVVLSLAVGLFWGMWPALLVAVFTFSALMVIWIFSPLITGLWLGFRFTQEPIQALLLGVFLLVLLTGLPLVGFMVSFFSFVLALGSLLLVSLVDLPEQG